MGKIEQTLPVDRGWAWAICTAGCIAYSVLQASQKTTSILFVELLDKYETPITKGSLLIMFHILAFSFSSVIVTNFVIHKVGERRLVFLGGLLSFVASVSAAVAPNMDILITVWTIKGVAAGMCFAPGMTLIRVYFKRRRSVASSAPFCAGSASSMIFPHLIRAIRKEYGISNTFLVMAALELHMCVAGLLLRPVSAYKNLPEDTEDSPASDALPDKAKDVRGGEETEVEMKNLAGESGDQTEDETGKDDSDGDTAVTESLLASSESSPEAAHDDVLSPGKKVQADIVMTTPETPNPDKPISRWKKWYHNASLGMWSFRMMLLACIPGTVQAFVMNYLPTVTYAQGATLDQSAILLSCMSGVDLISRFSSGVIADTHVLSPSSLLALFQLGMGAICLFLPLATTFPTLVAVVLIMGLFVGSRGALIQLLTSQVVGLEKMPPAYGIVCMVMTLFGAASGPALSAVAQVTGDFVYAMYMTGVSFIIGAALFAVIPLVIRLDKARGRAH